MLRFLGVKQVYPLAAVYSMTFWQIITVNVFIGRVIDMEYMQVLFSAIGSFVALFILTKIMGYKQMSQLTMFDYITGITIGSIASEMATMLEGDFFKPLIALVVYSLAAALVSYISTKSFAFRRFVTGKASVLYNNGTLYEENFKKAKMEINEFLMMARNSGYFDLSALETVILEPNGKLSFLPRSTERPVVPADLDLTPQQETMCSNVIMDGHILHENLKFSGVNEEWLLKELEKQKIKYNEVFLGLCDGNKQLKVYKKTGKHIPNDILE